MNRIYKTRLIISFDVWEPQQELVKHEVDLVVTQAKKLLTHAGRLKIASEQHEEKMDQ